MDGLLFSSTAEKIIKIINYKEKVPVKTNSRENGISEFS